MNPKSLWQAALGELEVALSKASFTTWFRDTFIYSFENEVVIIGVPDSFHKEWLENKFKEEILKTLTKISQSQIKEVRYKVITKKEAVLPKTTPFILKKEEPKEIILNPYYTFETFVVGPSNRLAHAAALAVAKSPGESYNPLFVYGGVGLGKTHLMQAIGNGILGRENLKKVLYVTCERFINDFIRSVQSGRATSFKDKYRNIDVLLIDDIQFLAGKERSKEEFFHTFNSLHQNNKQIVISSDRPPKALSSLEDRLISRFEGGMVADISPPDLETRIAILRQKAKERNYPLDEEIMEFIASKIEQNIRELEGALTRLVATCQLSGESPSLDRAHQILSSLGTSSKGGISIEKIFTEVAGFYGLKKEDILNKKRDKELVHPRQITMFLLRHELSFSFPKIGRELKRDHTTVIHGCEKIEKEIIQNNGLKQEIALIKARIYGE